MIQLQWMGKGELFTKKLVYQISDEKSSFHLNIVTQKSSTYSLNIETRENTASVSFQY